MKVNDVAATATDAAGIKYKAAEVKSDPPSSCAEFVPTRVILLPAAYDETSLARPFGRMMTSFAAGAVEVSELV